MISAHHPQLLAAILALKGMDRTLRKEVYAATRTELVPAWREVLNLNVRTDLERRVLIAGGARVDAHPEGVRMRAATSTRAMKGGGGASPALIGHAVEWGATPRVAKIDARRRDTGKSYTYSRKINTQLPLRRRSGGPAMDTVAEMAPRWVSLWVQTIIRTMLDAVEGKAK